MIDSAPNGLILGGGRSSRMGTDKGMLDFHGLPQRDWLRQLLKPHCADIFLSCKHAEDVPKEQHPLPDRFEIQSPLNGILSALTFDSTRAWLTVPVDMPAIDDVVITHLLANRDRNVMATCFYDSTGTQPEPLLCVWEPRAFAALVEYAREGNISPRTFLETHQVKLLVSPFPELHTNINSPSDFEEFKKRRYS